MTHGTHIMVTGSGFAARGPVRAFMQPRPSLGSSHALLLLSSP